MFHVQCSQHSAEQERRYVLCTYTFSECKFIYFSYTKTFFINFDRFELAIIKFSIKIIYKFRLIIMIVPRINYVIQEKYVLHITMNGNIFKFI